MKKGFVISDLHIFYGRKDKENVLLEISKKTKDANFLVLNGDIFDFRQADERELKKRHEKIFDIINQISKENKQRKILYVMGNHEGIKPMLKLLEELSSRLDNFFFFQSHAKIGDNFFLHGDLIFSSYNQGNKKQRKIREKPKIIGLKTKIYRAILKYRLHFIIKLLFSKKECAKKIISFIEQEDKQMLKDIKNVYFGHIHNAFENYKYKDYKFFNSGVCFGYIKAKLIPFFVEESQDKITGR